jgi:uncharacterized membrane protein
MKTKQQLLELFIDFFIEMYTRFFMKSPLFFQILQIVGGIAFLITGIPEIIDSLALFGIFIELPAAWVAIQNKAIAIASFVLFLTSKFTVDPTQNIEKNKLPFTLKKTTQIP